MSLTKKDLEQILKIVKITVEESIERNNHKLMLWFSENFYTKAEAASKKDLENELKPIKEDIGMLKDSVTGIKNFIETDYVILESQVSENTLKLSQISSS